MAAPMALPLATTRSTTSVSAIPKAMPPRAPTRAASRATASSARLSSTACPTRYSSRKPMARAATRAAPPAAARRQSFGNGLVSMLATSWTQLRFGLVALALCLGCSGHDASMPTTYPVTGTVTTELGQPYPGGSLQFRPDSNEDLTVLGDIEKD